MSRVEEGSRCACGRNAGASPMSPVGNTGAAASGDGSALPLASVNASETAKPASASRASRRRDISPPKLACAAADGGVGQPDHLGLVALVLDRVGHAALLPLDLGGRTRSPAGDRPEATLDAPRERHLALDVERS